MSGSFDIDDLSVRLMTLNRYCEKVYKKFLDQYHMNASAVNLINVIQDDTLSLTEITEMTGLDKSTVSRQMNALVEKDYVIKTSGEDKRFTLFQLTTEARTIYHEIKTEFNDFFDHSLDKWSEEEKQMLYVLLGRLYHSLSSNFSKGGHADGRK